MIFTRIEIESWSKMDIGIILICMFWILKLLLIVFFIKQLQEAGRNPQNYMEVHLLRIELLIILLLKI